MESPTAIMHASTKRAVPETKSPAIMSLIEFTRASPGTTCIKTAGLTIAVESIIPPCTDRPAKTEITKPEQSELIKEFTGSLLKKIKKNLSKSPQKKATTASVKFPPKTKANAKELKAAHKSIMVFEYSFVFSIFFKILEIKK